MSFESRKIVGNQQGEKDRKSTFEKSRNRWSIEPSCSNSSLKTDFAPIGTVLRSLAL